MSTQKKILIGIPICVLAISISDTWLSGWLSCTAWLAAIEIFKEYKTKPPTP